jgi:plasmid stabilization system protein ParE
MKPSIVITAAAELDLAEAIEWYEAISPALPLAFRVALDTTLCLIADYPESYSIVSRDMRRALLRRFPHAIFYRPERTAIQVIGVLPTMRNPRVWQARNH